MFIEFKLPSGAGGMAAAYTLQQLRKLLTTWAEKYQVEILNIKTIKYTVRVTLVDPKYYEFFALTWNPETNSISYIKNFRFVEPMK